jgi:hypothetical protein
MAESPVQPGLLAVGTDDGNVQISRDGGVNWINLTSKFNGVPENTWVSKIELSRFDPKRIYVTFDGHRADDFNAYVFASNDGGETWQAINRGLPKVSVRTLREDLRNQNLLFAGTESGLFVSLDRGGSWSRFKNGMSDAPVFKHLCGEHRVSRGDERDDVVGAVVSLYSHCNDCIQSARASRLHCASHVRRRKSFVRCSPGLLPSRCIRGREDHN